MQTFFWYKIGLESVEVGSIVPQEQIVRGRVPLEIVKWTHFEIARGAS